MPRAAVYARVSDKIKQGKNYSLPTQIEECQKHADARGHIVVAIFQETHTSTELERPELDKLRELARSKSIDVLIVLEIDRLARDMVYQLLIEDEFKGYGVTIEYALAEYDDTPEGRLQKHIRTVVAEYEREKIIQRTKRGRYGYAKAGKIAATRVRPFGYWYIKKADGGPRLEIIQEEALIVILIFTWIVYGDETGKKLSLQGVADKLTEMGILTAFDRSEREQAREKQTRRKAAGVWSVSTLATMIKNELYAGTAYYGMSKTVKDPTTGKRKFIPVPRSEWIPIPVPAIISKQLWDDAQAQLRVNSHLAPRNTKEQYLMRGLMTCSRCGLSFSSRINKGIRIHRCGGTERQNILDSKGCMCHGYIRADFVEPLVWAKVREFLLEPDKLLAGIREQQRQAAQDVEPQRLRLESVDREIATRRQAKDNAYLAFEMGRRTKEEWLERDTALDYEIAKFEAERTIISAKLDQTAISEAAIEEIRKYCEFASEGIDDFTAEDQRIALELLNITGVVQRGEYRAQDVLILTGRIPLTVIPFQTEIASTSLEQSGRYFSLVFSIPLSKNA